MIPTPLRSAGLYLVLVGVKSWRTCDVVRRCMIKIGRHEMRIISPKCFGIDADTDVSFLDRYLGSQSRT